MKSSFSLFFISVLSQVCLFAQSPLINLRLDGNTTNSGSLKTIKTENYNTIPTADRFNNPCGAMYFNGTNAFIKIKTNDTLNKICKNFTILTWVRPIYDNRNNWLTIVCKGAGSTEDYSNPQFRFQLLQSLKLNLSTFSIHTSYTEYDSAFLDHLIPNRSWSHVALSFNNGAIEFYNDGKLIYKGYTDTLPISNTEDLYVGMDEPGNSEFWRGDMDDFKLYSKSLTSQEILSLYKKELTQQSSSLTDLYSCDDLNYKLEYNTEKCGAQINYLSLNEKIPLCKQNNSELIINGPKVGEWLDIGEVVVSQKLILSNEIAFFCLKKLNVIDSILPVVESEIIELNSINGQKVIVPETNVRWTDNCNINSAVVIEGVKINQAMFPGEFYRIYRVEDASGNHVLHKQIIKINSIVSNNKLKTDSPIVVSQDKKKIEPQVSTFQNEKLIVLLDVSNTMKKNPLMTDIMYELLNMQSNNKSLDSILIISFASNSRVLFGPGKIDDGYKDSLLDLQYGSLTDLTKALNFTYSRIPVGWVEQSTKLLLITDCGFTIPPKKFLNRIKKNNEKLNIPNLVVLCASDKKNNLSILDEFCMKTKSKSFLIKLGGNSIQTAIEAI